VRHVPIQICQKMERNENAFTFSAPSDDVFSVSSILKVFHTIK
jgi:hypothetical protein